MRATNPGTRLYLMINNLSLLFSIAAVFYVTIRAAMLDRKLPWFGPRPDRLAPVARPTRRL